MGADGHVFFLRADVVLEQFAGLDARRIGWQKRVVLGVEVLWRYWDTSGNNDTWDNPAEYVREFATAVYRSRPDDPPQSDNMRKRSLYVQQRDLDFIAKCKANPDHEKEMAEGKRYAAFEAWLDAHADDWEVWT